MSTRLWNPFANMADIAERKLVIDRADGVWVYDNAGRRYLDATSSLWYCNVGHGRSEIIQAIHSQLLKLDVYNAFGPLTNAPSEMLADKLADLSPYPNSRVFLNSGGGDSIDSAIKIARRYHSAMGNTQKQYILSRNNGYHGANGIGTGISGIRVNREGFGAILPLAKQVDWNSVEDLRATIDTLGAENIAAFVFEPVIGAGGVLYPPEGYIGDVIELCRSRGILSIADSVICGFGRLGDWFGVERWSSLPDMVVFAKGVTSGYQPLGGVVIDEKVAEPFWNGTGVFLKQGATYSGHPAASAAALANIAILEREQLLERSRIMESALSAALLPLEQSPAVAEVRAGFGMMGAIELAPELLEERPNAAEVAHLDMRDRGIFTRVIGNSLAVSPPLTIEQNEIDFIGSSFNETIGALTAATV